MSDLAEKQDLFTGRVAMLIFYAHTLGYTLSFGEAYRTPEQAALNAAKGTGIKNSLHCRRLAIDLNFFKDGKLVTDGSQLKDVGEYWESIGGTWGGRFGDGNHFSLADGGQK